LKQEPQNLNFNEKRNIEAGPEMTQMLESPDKGFTAATIKAFMGAIMNRLETNEKKNKVSAKKYRLQRRTKRQFQN